LIFAIDQNLTWGFGQLYKSLVRHNQIFKAGAELTKEYGKCGKIIGPLLFSLGLGSAGVSFFFNLLIKEELKR
jgi:hypothetical protein